VPREFHRYSRFIDLWKNYDPELRPGAIKVIPSRARVLSEPI
jgi:hypothetical protein